MRSILVNLQNLEGFKAIQERSELQNLLETLRNYRGKLEEEFAVKRVGIFDSFAKGVAAEESDVNFLVEFDRDLPLIGFSLLWNSLKNSQEEEWTS